MSRGLRELTSQELSAALESVLLPRLCKVLAARDLGHCMRVTDLDRELMIRLAGGCVRPFLLPMWLYSQTTPCAPKHRNWP